MPCLSSICSTATDWERAGHAVLEVEAASISAAAARLDGRLSKAVRLVLGHSGKVIVTGIGKSGHVARKIAATLSSTGTPAVFLHAAEAVHGDLGVCEQGDPVVLLSKSGTTAEMLALVPMLRQLQCPLIGIVGNLVSPLAREVDVLLDGVVRTEADPHNLVPTASAAVFMALGDALAVALMVARGFTVEDFGRRHPGGQLGRNSSLLVRDVMHTGEQVAWVCAGDSLKHVVIAMTERPLGAACVIENGSTLSGLITDGDLRRALTDSDDIRSLTAGDFMNRRPATVSPDARLSDALRLMEDRPSQISVLPVVAPQANCLGLIRLHDIYGPKQ